MGKYIGIFWRSLYETLLAKEAVICPGNAIASVLQSQVNGRRLLTSATAPFNEGVRLNVFVCFCATEHFACNAARKRPLPDLEPSTLNVVPEERRKVLLATMVRNQMESKKKAPIRVSSTAGKNDMTARAALLAIFAVRRPPPLLSDGARLVMLIG